MRKIITTALAMLMGTGLILTSSVSRAEDVTFKLEPGVSVPLTPPQSDRFDTGGSVSGKLLVGVTPFLDIGPSVGFLALPSALSGSDTGTAWSFGGGLRVKRPHDLSNKGTGFTAVSPWLDTDLQYVRTGDLNRAGAAVGAGAAVPTSASRRFWVGPFVRYQNIFQSEKIGFDGRDAKILTVGLSLEIGPRVASRAPLPPLTGTPTPPVVPETPPVVPEVPPVVPEVRVELNQKIQFDWDSAELLSSQTANLEEVKKVLLAHSTYKVKIEGHASSEGGVEHNDALAQKRADAVLEYLASNGVSRDNMSATGFGSRVPVASNDTQVGREANRRVEFVVNFVIVKEGK